MIAAHSELSRRANYLIHHPPGKGPKAEFLKVTGGPVLAIDLAHQAKHCRYKAQTVVRFSNDEAAWDVCFIAAGDHKCRVGRNPEKGPVIAAGIKALDVKIPEIISEHQQIGLAEITLALAKSSDQPLFLRYTPIVTIEKRLTSELLIQSYQTV